MNNRKVSVFFVMTLIFGAYMKYIEYHTGPYKTNVKFLAQKKENKTDTTHLKATIIENFIKPASIQEIDVSNYVINTYTIYKKNYDVWTPVNKCRQNQVVIGVLSNKFQHRQNIRDSWGSITCVFFLLAAETTNYTDEMKTYNDIITIQIPEAYSGWKSALPVKTAVWFTFVQNNMFKVEYAVKTDDDSYIRVLPLIKSLINLKADYSGFILKNVKPNRDKNSRHYTPLDMYASNEFPSYALGAGYSLSRHALKCYKEKIEHADYISNEDVGTGIIMSMCGILGTHDRSIFPDRAFDKHLSIPFTIKHHVSVLQEHKLDISNFFVKMQLSGRMGNHLFKIASVVGIAKHYNAEACYEDSFLGHNLLDVHVSQCKKTKTPVKQIHEVGHAIFDMPDWPNYTNSHDLLLGIYDYRQSFKYFQHLDINQVFSIKLHLQTKSLQKMSSICKKCIKIGIHVRRTDMLTPNSHIFSPSMDYFQSAIEFMQQRHQNVMFYVASDDIVWCREKFGFLKNIVFLHGSKEDDFLALTSCDHMILSVGTFGWWVAFLGSHQRGGDIVYFTNEFKMHHVINEGHVKHEDYYPPSWIGLSGR